MTDDIIQPSVRHGDAQFVKPWRRKQDYEKCDSGGALDRSGSRCKTLDLDTIRRFRELYIRGATHKRIILDLGLSERTIKRMRIELELPKRRADKGDTTARVNTEWVTFSLDLPAKLYRRMDAHVSTRFRSKAHYVRALIERDLE